LNGSHARRGGAGTGGLPLQKWIALAEVVLANLAWIDELDLEGWLLAMGAAVAIGAAIWLLIGPWWLVLATSLYLALLVVVKILANRGRD
jgi:hypothetical protein